MSCPCGRTPSQRSSQPHGQLPVQARGSHPSTTRTSFSPRAPRCACLCRSLLPVKRRLITPVTGLGMKSPRDDAESVWPRASGVRRVAGVMASTRSLFFVTIPHPTSTVDTCPPSSPPCDIIPYHRLSLLIGMRVCLCFMHEESEISLHLPRLIFAPLRINDFLRSKFREIDAYCTVL